MRKGFREGTLIKLLRNTECIYIHCGACMHIIGMKRDAGGTPGPVLALTFASFSRRLHQPRRDVIVKRRGACGATSGSFHGFSCGLGQRGMRLAVVSGIQGRGRENRGVAGRRWAGSGSRRDATPRHRRAPPSALLSPLFIPFHPWLRSPDDSSPPPPPPPLPRKFFPHRFFFFESLRGEIEHFDSIKRAKSEKRGLV